MIREKINELIAYAIKSKDETRKNVYRDIKTAILNFKSSHKQQEPSEQDEISILHKMYNTRVESGNEYANNGRMDLAKVEFDQSLVLKELIPEEPSDSEIEEALFQYCINNNMGTENGNIEYERKDIKRLISVMRDMFPTAQGKNISKVITSYLMLLDEEAQH